MKENETRKCCKGSKWSSFDFSGKHKCFIVARVKITKDLQEVSIIVASVSEDFLVLGGGTFQGAARDGGLPSLTTLRRAALWVHVLNMMLTYLTN